MKAVVIGSTGLVGNALLDKLLSDPDFSEVVSINRKEIKKESAKLKQIIINSLEEINVIENQIEGDAFFCCLGTTIKTAGSQNNFRKVDQEAVIEFAKIAKNKNASVFVVITAQGADSNSGIFYNKVKGEVENTLKKMNLNHLVIMRPGLLIGERVEKRKMEKMMISFFQTISSVLPEKIQKSIATDIYKLSERMIALSKNQQEKTLVIGPKDI